MKFLERKIPPPVVAIVAALVIWWLAELLPASRWTFAGKNFVAVALGLVGVLFDAGSILAFRRERTSVNPLSSRATTALVTTGLNAVSRNPMYVGLVLIVTGVAVYIAVLPGLLVVGALVAYLTRFQIVPEERDLRALFGTEFERYCDRVRRWL